jgi:hypothetical protein
MASEPKRDPVTDPLLTSHNSALIAVGQQPNQVPAVTSIDQELATRNTRTVARLAKTFTLPTAPSAANIANVASRRAAMSIANSRLVAASRMP